MLVEVVIVFFCLIPHVVASEGNTTIQQLPFRLLGFNPCWLWSQISLVVCVLSQSTASASIFKWLILISNTIQINRM